MLKQPNAIKKNRAGCLYVKLKCDDRGAHGTGRSRLSVKIYGHAQIFQGLVIG